MARAALMDPAGELIFAGAAFASDEHGGGRAGNFFGEIENAPGSGVQRNPGDSRRGAHGFLLTAKENLWDISPRFSIAVIKEKSEEHSQDWLCHDFVHDEKSEERIWE